jgi:glycerophosphoryl diester phosphodiesterase
MDTIFAHRGSSLEAPENTLPAFQLALEQGCKAIEFDVQLTMDEELIVCHDEKIDRTTDGTGYIKDQTLASLKHRDAGSWFAREFQGTKLPTLEEVLAICQKDTLINIEIKNIPIFYKGIEEKTVSQIKRFDFDENTIVSSFDHKALMKVQQLNPKIKIGVLLANRLIDPWNYIKQTGLNAYSIHPVYTFVDEHLIEQSHEAGFKVYPFTVDKRKTYEYLKSMGTDGIFTNIPTRFLNR